MAGNGGGVRAGVTREAYGRKFCRVKFFGWIAVCAAEIIFASNETTQRCGSQGKCFGAEACVDSVAD
jgi:hypothetical protein